MKAMSAMFDKLHLMEQLVKVGFLAVVLMAFIIVVAWLSRRPDK